MTRPMPNDGGIDPLAVVNETGECTLSLYAHASYEISEAPQ